MLPAMRTFLFTATLVLSGCAAASDETTQYLGGLQPLLQENGMLAERVLLQSAKIYNDAVKPEQVADAWIHEIVPLAEHLHNQSSFVTPPSSYAQTHADLVLIWGDRALAYRNLGEAIQTGNTDEWNKARELANQVKLREERWFDTLNGALAPSNIQVDPYP
jgi:hypothetical protein